ncbi:helix-turn-helix transcriptional regulator [Hymenobacter sp. 15J16-1T3B]|uniref:helix-turn-helix transcriptional regulator n=1 Tax=Hymenobacter sp. 15J16-1T3B TaxID=2886941 RepID=UPI001D12A086|nr:helix-turn-helix transcriptional regulator [Hymenobacter sp. 15J16-1T3B]MCC3157420.1 helix-turn-helix transcriptional regulator [Hymenobacter sp. 15J16-1T3B]
MEQAYHTPPDSPLHDVLRQCWQMERTAPTRAHETIIPKGLVEIIFNLNDREPVTAQIETQAFQLPRCFLSGFNSVPVQTWMPRQHSLFGVVLHPSAAARIFRVEATDFVNQCLDLTLVHAPLLDLWHQLLEHPGFAERVALVQRWLLPLRPEPTAQERFLNDYLNRGAAPDLTVPALADQLCYSPRHLTRKLQALTGMNAEQTLLYQKYRRAVELMHTTELTLTEIAHACQFTDQAHFSKTFRGFACLAPREYRRRKSHLPGHLFADVG